MFAFLHRVGTNYAFWYRHTQTQRRNNYKSRLHQRFVTTKKGLSILIAMLLCNLTIATPHIWCGQWRQLLLTNSFNDDTMPGQPTIARPDLTTGLSLPKHSRPTTVRTSITVPRHSRTVAPHLDLSRSGKATRGNTIQNPRQQYFRKVLMSPQTVPATSASDRPFSDPNHGAMSRTTGICQPHSAASQHMEACNQ